MSGYEPFDYAQDFGVSAQSNAQGVARIPPFIQRGLRDPAVCEEVTRGMDMVINLAAKVSRALIRQSEQHNTSMWPLTSENKLAKVLIIGEQYSAFILPSRLGYIEVSSVARSRA